MERFTVEHFHDLLRLLQERPEWREELRRVLLTDEILGLPEAVRELAEAQKRTEESLRALTARVEELGEAQKRTEKRVEELARAQERTERTLATLVTEVGMLKGDALERRYRERPFAYFGRILRKAHALTSDELTEILERGIEKGVITREEAIDIAEADAIVRGRWLEDGEEIYLVVEVSWGVGLSDVERAKRRAELLARLGLRTKPVVAGMTIIPPALERATEEGVYPLVREGF